MVFLTHILLPVIATLGLALTPIDTMDKILPNISHLDPFPIPFPVPGTDITLDFLPQPGFVPRLLQADVIEVFAMAMSDIKAYIRVQGNSPIMGNEYVLVHGEAGMTMSSSDAPMDPFRYSDALSVLLAILLKLARDGCSNTAARVHRTGSLEAIGFAAVYRLGVMRDVTV